MPHKGDMMTVREIVETLGLAADEDAVRKMAEYNAMVIAMSRKMNLTGIKDAEESLVKNIYDSLTVYEEKYFPKNGRMLNSAGHPAAGYAGRAGGFCLKETCIYRECRGKAGD